MSARVRKGLLAGCLLFVLTGCSYHDQLRNLQLIYATALDETGDRGVRATVTIQSPGSQERQLPANEVIRADGVSLEQALFQRVATQIAGPIGTSKNQVILIGEQLARQDVSVVLDSVFRNSNDPVQSRVAIVPGEAAKLIELKRHGTATVGEYLRKIMMSAHYETNIPDTSLHSLFPAMLDPGRDTVLPIIDKEEDKAVVRGIALLNERRYSGVFIPVELSPLFQLMNGDKGGICDVTRELRGVDGKGRPLHVSVDIVDYKKSRRVSVGPDGRVRVDLRLKLKAKVVEYPKNDLGEESTIRKLNEQLSETFTEDGERIADLLLRANCDALGIGRELIAYHHAEWLKMDWLKVYPKTDFNVKIDTAIVSTGVKK